MGNCLSLGDAKKCDSYIDTPKQLLSNKEKQKIEHLDDIVDRIMFKSGFRPKPFSLKMESCFSHIPEKDYRYFYESVKNLSALELSDKLYKEMKSLIKWAFGPIKSDEKNDSSLSAERVDEFINKAQIYFNLIANKKDAFIQSATTKEKQHLKNRCKYASSCLMALIKNEPFKIHVARFDDSVRYINNIKDPLKILVLNDRARRYNDMEEATKKCAEVTALVICSPLLLLTGLLAESVRPDRSLERDERKERERREREDYENRVKSAYYNYYTKRENRT